MESPLLLVSNAVWRFGLINQDDRLIVGFSGGPDSVFLVHAIRELFPTINLHLAHLDHGLREDSGRDAEFCVDFAGKLGLSITVGRENVSAIAEKKGVGLEEAGRNARYRLFRKLRDSLGFTKIATGHTLSDWLETYMMNLFRGTGIRGIRGLPPREGEIIRPLIFVEKEAILEYLEGRGIAFLEDPTNLDVRFTRNWVRHELMPLVKGRFPGAAEALRRHIIATNEALDYIRNEALALAEATRKPSPRGEHIFNRDTLLDYNSFLLKMMVLETVPGLTAQHLDYTMAIMARGGEIHFPDGWKAQASEGDLRFFREERPGWRGEILVEREGVYPVPELNLKLEVTREPVEKSAFSASFPEEVLPFSFRTRRPGDRWGKKPLKDKMINLRIPAWRRDLIPLAVRESRVFWVPGFAAWRMIGKKYLNLIIRRLSDEFWVYDF
ncbi:MAG: tRNA lysidine(34) synthetase TilS [candidate division WOR-3 bacterium]